MNAFSGIIGHDKIQEVLSRNLEHETLPHALLFVGSDGLGKTCVAQKLIRLLLNHSGDMGLHSDYLELSRLTDEKTGKRKSTISVAQVRELNSRLGLTSISGGWKVVFIEEASHLSSGASNALLKTIEEPKGKTLFLLTASSGDRLPATIVSRCQTLRFSPVPRADIKTGLVKMGFSPVDAGTASAQSLGRPGRAIKFLKESVYRAQQETGMEQAVRFFSSPLATRLGQVTDLIPKTEIQKDDALLETLDQWELVCRDLLFHQLGLGELRVFPETTKMNVLGETLTQEQLLSVFDRMKQVRIATKQHINSHLALEHIALSI
ncbi:AAA family ATPase [Candidatus Uhrbacteria bacterium]|nr:AAA family ATPase [Candidatus Uhrbacteria bacterium]